MYYIFNFVVYSIMGYFVELVFKDLLNLKMSSGFLFGPYTPIYGLGITLIFAIFLIIDKKYIKKINKIFLFFIIAFFLLTIMEEIGGILIHIVFHKDYWNYESFPLNIGPYISIEMSIIWSVSAILAYFYLKPLTDKFYNQIKKIIIKIIFLIMIIDSLITLILKSSIL